MNRIFVILILMICVSCKQKETVREKYIVKDTVINNQYQYYVINFKNDTILKLNPDEYFVCFNENDTVENFLVVAPKKRDGWWAIDFNEDYLFQVYNVSEGEPSPDELSYGRIRIIDDYGKIGYANKLGKIVIKPQFEYATAFYKNYAIIGEECKKIPWETKTESSDQIFHPYSIKCSRYGYIDKKGKVMEMGNWSYEELRKKLNFPDEL